MNLDTDPFPINVVEFEQKNLLFHTDHAATTKGKMIKPRSPEVGVERECAEDANLKD
jgi:hypothetical protein